MEPPGAVREAFERDGFYIFRNILDSSALAAPQRQLEEKVEAMASALRAARAEARAPPRSSHADAPFASRWARLAQAFAQDCRAGLVPTDKLALISSGSWGRTDMLDPRVHALLTHEPLLEVAKLLLGDEVTVNGDYYFRPAVSDTIVDWGLEYHQDSFNYGGDIHARPLRPQVEGLQVLTLWLPLVPVDETSGALSLVKGSHRRGKIWPATIAPADRDPQRQTTFSDLVPRPPVAQRQAAGAGAAVEQPYSSENWPDGVGLYGEVVAPSLQPGDVLAFHNMLMHGTSPHLQPDRVRWSVDLRYMSSSQGFSWHKMGDTFEDSFPCFVAATAEEGRQADSFEDWQRKWERISKL